MNDKLREELGKAIHESWCRTKRAQGFHGPNERCYAGYVFCVTPSPDGDFSHCPKFRADLIPWEELPERQKDINRYALDDVLPVLERYRLGEHENRSIQARLFDLVRGTLLVKERGINKYDEYLRCPSDLEATAFVTTVMPAILEYIGAAYQEVADKVERILTLAKDSGPPYFFLSNNLPNEIRNMAPEEAIAALERAKNAAREEGRKEERQRSLQSMEIRHRTRRIAVHKLVFDKKYVFEGMQHALQAGVFGNTKPAVVRIGKNLNSLLMQETQTMKARDLTAPQDCHIGAFVVLAYRGIPVWVDCSKSWTAEFYVSDEKNYLDPALFMVSSVEFFDEPKEETSHG